MNSSQVTERFRHAAERGDVDAVLATLSPAVVLRSPITDRVVFNGPAGFGFAPFAGVSVMLHGTPAPTFTKPAPVSCCTVAVNVCG